MALDLLLRQARLTEGKEALADIAIADGRIVEIADRIVADARRLRLGFELRALTYRMP